MRKKSAELARTLILTGLGLWVLAYLFARWILNRAATVGAIEAAEVLGFPLALATLAELAAYLLVLAGTLAYVGGYLLADIERRLYVIEKNTQGGS